MIKIIWIFIKGTLVTIHNNDSEPSLASFWTSDLRPSIIKTIISWVRNFPQFQPYLPTVQIWVGKISTYGVVYLIKISKKKTLQKCLLFSMLPTITFSCDFTKKFEYKKSENFAKKSAILCNLPFWLEIHFGP